MKGYHEESPHNLLAGLYLGNRASRFRRKQKSHLWMRWPSIFRATKALYRVGESNSTFSFSGFLDIDIHLIKIDLIERTAYFGDDFGHCFDYR